MSLRVGLGASQADLDVQGEIDFDFFEENDCSVSKSNQSTSHSDDASSTVESKYGSEDVAGPSNSSMLQRNADVAQSDPVSANTYESCTSRNLNKPLITISCDEATGMIQKTNIETVIPTPYTCKDKCENNTLSNLRKGLTSLSPRLKSKIFKDDNEISDDSSISSMSESEESAFSSVSEDSFEMNESDSMTDVSPLASPFKCPSPFEQSDKSSKSAHRQVKKEGVKFVDEMGDKQCPKCESLNFQELFHAMNRLQMTQSVHTMHGGKCKSPVMTQNAKSKKNLSFSNEEVRKIDNDNQVLLKKILAQQNRSKTPVSSAVPVRASSAVTRQRQQRQIEVENLALLKRLESTKPTRNLRRNLLLRDYNQRSAGVLSRASSRSSYPSSSSQTSFRTSSHTSGRCSAISIKSSNSSAHSKSFPSDSSSISEKA